MKGGYQLLNMKQTALTSGTPATIPGAYAAAANADKPVCIVNTHVGGVLYHPFYIAFALVSGAYVGTAIVNDKALAISITSADAVTVTVTDAGGAFSPIAAIKENFKKATDSYSAVSYTITPKDAEQSATAIYVFEVTEAGNYLVTWNPSSGSIHCGVFTTDPTAGTVDTAVTAVKGIERGNVNDGNAGVLPVTAANLTTGGGKCYITVNATATNAGATGFECACYKWEG